MADDSRYTQTNKKQETLTKKVFRQLGPHDRFLWRGRSGHWWVGSAHHRAAQEPTGWLVTAKPCEFPVSQTWHAWSKESQTHTLDRSIRCNVPYASTVYTVPPRPMMGYEYNNNSWNWNGGQMY